MPTPTQIVNDALARFAAGEAIATTTPAVAPTPAPAPAAKRHRVSFPRPNGELYYARMLDATTHDVGLLRSARSDSLDECLFTLLHGVPGTGKALGLSTPVLTPTGWVTAGVIKVGDRMVGRDGQPTRVTAVYPQPVKPMYRITFSDGVQIDANAEHLWQVRHTERQNRTRPDECWLTLNTEQIVAHGVINSEGRKCWEIPMLTAPVEFAASDALPMDPYTLGVWLGDGNSIGSTHPSAGYKTTCKVDHAARVTTDLEILEAIGATALREKRGCWEGRIRVPNSFGLRRKRSHEKFIPAGYLTAAPADRLALLQGLLDTDGHSQQDRSAVQYSTTSPMLADGVTELVRSLGGLVTVTTKIPTFTYKGKRKEGKLAYSVMVKLPPHMAPFRLARKAEKYRAPTIPLLRRTIESIEPIADDVSVCFTVDAEDHLFVIDGYVVTHNSSMAEAAFPDLITVSGDGDTTTDDFVGSWVQNPDGTYEWVDGPLVVAMEAGQPLLIDEIALIDAKVMSIVYSAMDGRGEVRIKTNPARGIVRAAPGFYVVGACNPHAPGARMSEALLSRFSIHIEATTDYDLAKTMGVTAKAVTAAKNLEAKRHSGEVSWSPQMRELLAFKRTEARFSTGLAVANLIGSAPEDDRPIVADVLSRAFGVAATSLRQGVAALA